MPLWLEVIVRTLVAIVVLFVLTRMLGKRQISQLSLFEYITGITIGSITAYISLDIEKDWYLGIIALAVWVIVSYLIELLQLKSKKLRPWIESSATVLIKNGMILEENLKKEKLTNEELLEQLRKKNIFNVAKVEFAIIEPNGEINVLPKKEYQSLTPSDLGMKVTPESEPSAVILDGNIMEKALTDKGLNRAWLNQEVEKLGLSIEDIFLAQVDDDSQLYIDLYNDKLANSSSKTQQTPELIELLKKCEADLEKHIHSIQQNDEKKQIYRNCYERIQKVISEIQPLLSN